MTIARFFGKSIIVSRLKTVSGDRKAFSSTATVDAHIQEVDPAARQALGIVEERAWVAYMDVEEDVQEGDRIQDEKSGTVYRVREITKKDYIGASNQHLEVLMEEFNA